MNKLETLYTTFVWRKMASQNLIEDLIIIGLITKNLGNALNIPALI